MTEFVAIAIRVLEVLFFAGWVGSAVVLLLTGVEDLRVVFKHSPPETH